MPNPGGEDGTAGDFVNSEAAAAWLWVLGNQVVGQEPGGFMSLILRAWLSADRQNQSKLDQGWPEYSFALEVFRQHGEDALISAAQRPARARANQEAARGDQG
jgi:hypothetical protein